MQTGTIGRLVFAMGLVALGTTRPAAAVDLSGVYASQVSLGSGAFSCELTFAQTGTVLQITATSGTCFGFSGSGTVVPSTGAFSVTGQVPGICTAVVLDGTGDGVVFAATVSSNCPGISGTVSGAKCSNGMLDPGEQCDDGNAVNGDCCSALCAIEPAGQACDDGNVCSTGDVCA